MRIAAQLLLLALCAACVAPAAPLGVLVATQPPGARIYVDGRDSGWVTPAHLGLDKEPQRLDIVLDGFDPVTVELEPGGDAYYLILWKESWVYHNTWRFPLWLNYIDGLAPIKLSKHLQPARIHVPLRATGID